MNYVQVELGGKLRGLKFNQGAHAEIQAMYKVGMKAIQVSYIVVYGGLLGNCFVKQIEPDFTFEEVCDWCDKLTVEQANAITDAYTGSLPVVEDKKKVIKKSPAKNTKRNVLK